MAGKIPEAIAALFERVRPAFIATFGPGTPQHADSHSTTWPLAYLQRGRQDARRRSRSAERVRDAEVANLAPNTRKR